MELFRSIAPCAAVAMAVACAPACASLDGLTGEPERKEEGGTGTRSGPVEPSYLEVPDAPVVVTGGSAEIAVVRHGALADEVTVALSGAPSGVRAEPLVLHASVARGVLRVSAAEGARQGAVDVDVLAAHSSGDKPAPAKSRLLVRGRPGTLDTSFGEDGIERGTLGGTLSTSRVLVDANGNIVGIGTMGSGGGARAFVARWRPNDGKLDTTFGSNGKRTNVFGDVESGARALLLLPNGDVAVGGYVRNDLAMAIVSPSGEVRGPFTYPVTMLFGTGTRAQVSGLAIQADGRILLGGEAATIAGDVKLVLARAYQAGQLDTGFGGDGIKVNVLSNRDNVAGVGVTTDGRIIVGGTQNFDQGNGVAAVFGLKPNGDVDTTFGNNGSSTSKKGYHDVLRGMALQADGAVLVTGYEQLEQGGSLMAVARFDPAGNPDASFGGREGAGWQASSLAEEMSSLDLQADGRILVGGRTKDAADFALVRLMPNGLVDGAFGSGGLAELSVAPGPGRQASITGLAHEADVPKSGLYGRIVAYGTTGASYALARVWP